MLNLKYAENDIIEAGLDEAGRGCLAGPVVAAAVILPKDFDMKNLDDSKKLSEKNRYILRDYIIKNAVDWSVQFVDNQDIDKINILNASIKAMHKCIDNLRVNPDLLLVDGNKFKPYKNIQHKTIVKGDALYAAIAAASVLAKTFRDDFMKKIDKQYPEYLWKKNKGYPTAEHRNAVLQYGLTKFHRKTFCNFYYQRKIDFNL